MEDENDQIYEIITEEEFNERNRKRKLEDFIEGPGTEFLHLIPLLPYTFFTIFTLFSHLFHIIQLKLPLIMIFYNYHIIHSFI